jgi:small subunit ribosomal protein S2
MAIIPMKALLESGVHFGHRTHKWHPGMKPYIFTERNGIHIIDLQKTVKSIETAYALVRDTVANGGTVLFVGTKRQAQETIQMEAIRAGMPYVTIRWLGGMLTNWNTIRGRINEMERLERMRDRGDFEYLTKKEAQNLNHEIERLKLLLDGMRQLTKVPDLVFVVDVRREEIAIHEANLLKIPVIAMVDTNCDPKNVDYVIPSNDDAIRAIKLLVGKVADAALEGRAMRKDFGESDLGTQPIVTVIEGADEQELTDEDLLGAATLAKIVGKTITIASDEDAEKLEEFWDEIDEGETSTDLEGDLEV